MWDGDWAGQGRGVCARPPGPGGSASSVPGRRSRGGWGGPSLPGTFLGGRGGARRAPGEDAEVSPLSPGAGAVRLPLARSFFSCGRSSASSPGQLTDLSALVPTGVVGGWTIFGGGCAHGAAGRKGAAPPGKALCCPSESEQGNQTETLEGSSLGARLSSFRGRCKDLCVK